MRRPTVNAAGMTAYPTPDDPAPGSAPFPPVPPAGNPVRGRTVLWTALIVLIGMIALLIVLSA